MLGLGSQVKRAHRAPLLDALVASGPADARAGARPACDLGLMAGAARQLNFQGDFYTHTLMTPVFLPGRPCLRAAAGLPGRGRRADDRGRRRGLRRLLLPPLHDRPVRPRDHAARLERGRAKAGRTDLDGFTVVRARLHLRRDETRPSWPRAIKGTKDQIAFYASTPAYRPVLDLHGWGDLQPELNALSKEGRWSEMGEADRRRACCTRSPWSGAGQVGQGLAANDGKASPTASSSTPPIRSTEPRRRGH